MRSVRALPLLATAVFAGEIEIGSDKPFQTNLSSCGNCWMNERVWSPVEQNYVSTGGTSHMCITGVSAKSVNQGANDAPYIPTDMNTTATAWTIVQIKEAFAMAPHVSFEHLFCGEYLAGYKDGKGHNSTTGAMMGPYILGEEKDPESVTYGPDGPGYENGDWGYPDRSGTGAACVRAKTVDAIVEADREVYAEYLKYGSSGRDAPGGGGHEGGPEGVPNGYASSYAIVSGTPVWQQRKWGTGHVSGSADLPANWCRSQMKQMLCHVAFPQVRQHTAFAANSNQAQTDRAYGRVRSVDYDTCKSVMQVCARRQPSGNETGSDFMAPEFSSTLGMFIQRNDTANIKGEKELQVDRVCDFWRIGLGLAKAGTGVGEQKVDGDMAQFGSATRVSVGYLVALVLLVVSNGI